jgi:hypothetical protein
MQGSITSLFCTLRLAVVQFHNLALAVEHVQRRSEAPHTELLVSNLP